MFLRYTFFDFFNKTLPLMGVSFADRMKLTSAKTLQLHWLYTFAGQTGQLQQAAGQTGQLHGQTWSPLELPSLAGAAQFGQWSPRVWLELAGAEPA